MADQILAVETSILIDTKGAGHSPHEYKRKECYDMFLRWIHYYPVLIIAIPVLANCDNRFQGMELKC
ncbi:hypothetical protein CFP56_040781 [Quercus suber]|uniref:Uncharacterized protein n=1 Tax=Quercus suber TaxID=58331 RepID=A0AAW0LLJ2_QUESU